MWNRQGIENRFKSGVSLHGHTAHSRESLRFIYRLARRSPALRLVLKRSERQYLKKYGRPLDLRKGWWTPPLDPLQAWTLEKTRLEQHDLAPLISLTDHDSITAPLTLKSVEESRDVPISVEWTLPYRGTELHIGLHNLPPAIAPELMRVLASFTQEPASSGPGDLLEFVASQPSALVVLNHPLWDETHVGETVHMNAVRSLLQTSGAFIHALEWNGLRDRRENLAVVGLARAWSKPIVSGGDRHTLEPNAVINLSNATTFDEFAEEVRHGRSVVLLTPTYHQPRTLRMTRMVFDVFSEQPAHARGWTQWSDRVFYVQGETGQPESLSSLWHPGAPGVLHLINATSRFLPGRRLQKFLEMTTGSRHPVLVSCTSVAS